MAVSSKSFRMARKASPKTGAGCPPQTIDISDNLIRKGQLLFTYFHFASDRELTLAMLSNKSICLAYETVEEADHSLPLLIPMSEVAGRMSIQEGARFLEKPQGGKGILLGGVPGV